MRQAFAVGIAIGAGLAVAIAAVAPAAAQSYYLLENTFYVEAGGPGGEVSLNFERRTAERLALRVGVGGTFIDNAEALTVPVTLSFLLGGRNNQVELGIGGSYFALGSDWQGSDKGTWLDMTKSQLTGVGVAAYRYTGDYGLFLRVAFTPILTKDELKPWGGVALGKSF
jgi:hypothetical protein